MKAPSGALLHWGGAFDARCFVEEARLAACFLLFAEQIRRAFAARRREPEMPPGRQRRDPPAQRALQKALLDQIGFDDVLDRARFLANGGGNVLQADRAAVETVHDGFQQLAVHQVEALRVDVQHRECLVGDAGDDAGNGGGGGRTDLADYQLRQELFQIVGLYQSGNGEIDRNCVFMDHGDFAKFFERKTARASLRCKLADPDEDFEFARAAIIDDWWAIENESLPEGRQPASWLRDENARASYAFTVLQASANRIESVRVVKL